MPAGTNGLKEPLQLLKRSQWNNRQEDVSKEIYACGIEEFGFYSFCRSSIVFRRPADRYNEVDWASDTLKQHNLDSVKDTPYIAAFLEAGATTTEATYRHRIAPDLAARGGV